MIVGVIVVASALFFLRLFFWRQEFKTTITQSKNQPSDTLKNFNNQWQEIRSSFKTQTEAYKKTKQPSLEKLDDQQLKFLKEEIEKTTKK